MKGKKNKFSISKLFYNNKFVMVFSILVAFGIWLMISSTSQEVTIFTVTDIPITLPQLGDDLQFFNAEGRTAEVKISGNALVVAGVNNSDIYITAADTSFITTPGKYKVSLVPKKVGIKTDYTFESTVSPTTIEVYVDRFAEKEIPISDKIEVGTVGKDYYVSGTQLSRQSVIVRGAESILNTIATANAEYSLQEELTKTTKVEAPIVFRDSDGQEISMEYITSEEHSVTATVPILKILQVPVVPTFTNAPSAFAPTDSIMTITPSTVQLAVPEDTVNDIKEISTSPIDMSAVNYRNYSVDAELNLPAGVKNLNQVTSANISFQVSALATKKIDITNFMIVNEGTNRKTTVPSKSLEVTLIGERSQISSLTADNITAVIDMSSKNSVVGFVEMPVTVNVNSKYPLCWVYATYTVAVNVVDTTITPEESSSDS